MPLIRLMSVSDFLKGSCYIAAAFLIGCGSGNEGSEANVSPAASPSANTQMVSKSTTSAEADSAATTSESTLTQEQTPDIATSTGNLVSPDSQPTIPLTAIIGSWQLSEIVKGATITAVLDPKAPYTLVFNTKGTASGKVACNRWQGKIFFDGDNAVSKFTLENAGTTRMRCHIENETARKLEQRFLRVLKGSVNVAMANGKLVLSFASGGGEIEKWMFLPLENSE